MVIQAIDVSVSSRVAFQQQALGWLFPTYARGMICAYFSLFPLGQIIFDNGVQRTPHPTILSHWEAENLHTKTSGTCLYVMSSRKHPLGVFEHKKMFPRILEAGAVFCTRCLLVALQIGVSQKVLSILVDST